MGTGYTRNDTSNNIADGNVIDAADLDGEFDSIQAAFNSNTGHTHDGTSAEGAPITVTGPAQEYVSTATELRAKTNNTYDLGSASVQWKNAYVAGNVTVGGTVDGRDVAADGTKLDGIEAGADVTDTANVTAAGALMDSELTNITAVKALNQGVATTDSPSFAAATINGNITVTGTVDGRDIAADGTKLDGIESGATADQTASEILTAIKTVDGAASGLDADLLDGQQGSYYLDANNFVNMPAGYTGWTVSDGTNSESVTDGSSVTFAGSGATSVSYNTTTNTVTISSTDTDTNTTYSAGTALDLSGTTFNVDLSELTTSTTDGHGDYFVVVDTANAQRKLTKGNINISGFNNDAGYTTNVGDITAVTAGSGLTGGGTSGSVTVSHADTSSQSSVNNSGNTVIQDISVDTYGHVTSIGSTTLSIPAAANNATITLAAGTGLSGGGSFTTNQSSNSTITFNAAGGGIGSGQSWGLYTGSRSAGTNYTNSTGTPIMVSVYGQKTSTNAIGQMAIAVDGTEVNRTFVTDGWAYGAFDCPASVVAIVPNGSTYRINLYNAAQITFWAELR